MWPHWGHKTWKCHRLFPPLSSSYTVVLVLSFATQVVQVQYLYRLPVHMYVIFSNFYTIPVTFPGLYFLTFLLSFPPLILERCCFCDFVALLDALILLACGWSIGFVATNSNDSRTWRSLSRAVVFPPRLSLGSFVLLPSVLVRLSCAPTAPPPAAALEPFNRWRSLCFNWLNWPSSSNPTPLPSSSSSSDVSSSEGGSMTALVLLFRP